MQSCLPDAAIGTNVFTHAYDGVGNHVLGGANAETNTFVVNCLNQRVSTRCVQPSSFNFQLEYAADGGLANDGRFAYAYDAEDRLASVTSLALTNGAVRVRNAYDWRNRRVAKCVDRYDAGAESWRLVERHDFVWDNWNIVHETVSAIIGSTTNVTEVQYFWGPDLSGTLDGAGGVGGLLAVSRDGRFYFPVYDNNGNVMKYVDESGSVVAAYVYDDFGATISQSGPLANVLSFGFSTKYFDRETGLVAYQLRFYSPVLESWPNRDPLEEQGGLNLYSMCLNYPVGRHDSNGALALDFPGMHDDGAGTASVSSESVAQLEQDREILEDLLVSMCPRKSVSTRIWNRDGTCCRDACLEQARNLAQGIFKAVRANAGEYIYGGWTGNALEIFGLGRGCREWQDIVYRAANSALSSYESERKCFRGKFVSFDFLSIGTYSLGEYSPIQHNWVEIIGPSGGWGVRVDPWRSGGRSLFGY